MICPTCGAEYRDGFTRCPDCLIDLVESSAVPAPAGQQAGKPTVGADTEQSRQPPVAGADLSTSKAPGARLVLRWLLAAVLACFAILRVVGAVRFTLVVADQSTSYYVLSAVIDLGPAVAEVVAVVLALRGHGGRLAWSILLACGLALVAVQSYYALTVDGFGMGMLEGVALVALALVHPRTAALRTATR